MIDFTPILQALVALIATIITVFVIPYIKSKTSAQQLEKAQIWTRIAVSAAEQLFSGTALGKQKKQYVLNFLAEHNIILDEAAVDALIESAVNALKNEQGFITLEGVGLQ